MQRKRQAGSLITVAEEVGARMEAVPRQDQDSDRDLDHQDQSPVDRNRDRDG
jgi:hypothetical protein